MKKTVRTANTEKIAKIASRVQAKLEERVEKILADAEQLVKQEFPAKYVSASLTKLQNVLFKEGIECNFDATLTRQAIRKTANSDITKDECDEAINEIAKAVVDETEASIDQCDTAIDTVAKKNFASGYTVAAKRIKKRVAAKLNANGLNFEF